MTTRVQITDYTPFQGGRAVAVVNASGRTVTIDGDPELAALIRSIAVLDPTTKKRLTADRDGERWAKRLPSAYRTPYVQATILREPAS